VEHPLLCRTQGDCPCRAAGRRRAGYRWSRAICSVLQAEHPRSRSKGGNSACGAWPSGVEARGRQSRQSRSGCVSRRLTPTPFPERLDRPVGRFRRTPRGQAPRPELTIPVMPGRAASGDYFAIGEGDMEPGKEPGGAGPPSRRGYRLLPEGGITTQWPTRQADGTELIIP
jgi:hypothetical protein